MIFIQEHQIGGLNSYNGFTFEVQLLRSLHVYDIFIQILNVHTHQYLYKFCVEKDG